jgi:hypothetical protein
MTADNVAVARQGYNHIEPNAGQRSSLRPVIRAQLISLQRRGLFTLIVLHALAAILAATAWLSWILMSGALGSQVTLLAVMGLVACAAALSWRTGRGFVSSLIMVGFDGFALLFAAFFAFAGYTLIFGS